MSVRNLTIALDEETARWARVEAARQDMSVSRFVAGILTREMSEKERYDIAMRSFFSRRPRVPISQPGQRYPTRDEVHDRADLR